MKKIIFISIGLLIIAGLIYLFSFYQKDSDKKYPTGGTNIIAFGDSLVSGYGVEEEENFVSLLSERLKVPIINQGVDGNTTEDGLTRVGRDVLAQDPKIVIVLLGGNDTLGRMSMEDTFSNLKTIIEAIHKEGAAVILVGVRGGLLQDHFSKKFRELAEEQDAFFVPNILDDILGNRNLMYDTIHPNGKGHVIMADRIEPVLRRVLDGSE